ncbi:hypothetical protein VTP01DRAFT_3737 [Rhizomucor pusillus]|uniref:uncharacterized protein n=1 Tax=Rhizomucor pusillus TaxID=4840 RepID=UPI003743BF31
MSGNPVAFFKTNLVLTTIDKFRKQFDHAKNAYVDFNLDIGWAAVATTDTQSRYKRKCCIHIVCENGDCRLYGQQLRPSVYGRRLVHYNCRAEVFYVLSGNRCVLRHNGIHNHNADKPYLTKHLSEEEKTKM